jgi:hypothetical protein
MSRRFTILATALLTIGIALPAKARADSIVITGGTAVVGDDYIGVVDIYGTQGFRAQLKLGLLQTGGPWQWNHAPTGTPIRLDAIFASWDGFGTVTLNGVGYRIPAEHEVIAIWTDGNAIPMPPPGPEPIRLIAPFTLHPRTPSTFQVMLPGNNFVDYRLFGRGTVTLDLTPAVADFGWRISRTQYEFDPVPEPASLLLLGTGIAALGAKYRRRIVGR